MMKKVILLVILWLGFSWGTPCQGEIPVHRQVLDNGLTVIVKEAHTSPIVALQLWVKVGSADESDDEAGITHLIEHMLFKGTATRKVGEIAREVETAGGIINASTSYDQTVFDIVIPSRYLSNGLSVLADAMQNSSFDSLEVEREKQVVLEEIRMRVDQPSVRLNEAVFKTAYTVHPYGRPIIGFDKTVRNFDRGKVLSYYRKWYVPENMSLVLTGDVSPDKALAAVKDAFKNFSSRLEAPSKRFPEPSQGEFRSTVLREEVQKAYMTMAFHIPGLSHDDTPALDVLGSLLGMGESSRLYQKVKAREKLVYSITAYAYTPKEPGLFVVGGNMETDNVTSALDSILREICRLQREPASPEEIQRAKINLESDFVYGRETVEGEARQLGEFETLLGDVTYEQTYLARIHRVTAQDVSRVAREYLNPQNLTVGLLIPGESATNLTPEALREVAANVDPPSSSPENPKMPAVTKDILPNGITLVVNENHRLPIVAMKAVFLGGTRFEARENNGINNFVAGMLVKGTKSRSALQIAEEIESMAGKIGGFSGRNSLGVSCTVLSQFFEKGLDLFADVILNPSFPAEEVEKKRADILAAIDRREDQPFSFVLKEFDALFFGNHPYGMDALGKKETIGNLTGLGLQRYYSNLARTRNMVLAIAGDVDAKALKERLCRLFQGLSDEDPLYPVLSNGTHPAFIRKKELVKGKRAQAHIMLGFPGVAIQNPDKYSLQVLTTVLAGQGGRLFSELRDKQSLAYALSPFEWEGLDPGYIAFYLGCSPAKVGQAVEGILWEIKKLTEEKVSSQELMRAQNYIVGNFSIEHQSNDSLASEMAFNERYGLGYSYSTAYLDKILQVSAEDIQRAAKTYFDLERYTLLVVIPKETPSIQ